MKRFEQVKQLEERIYEFGVKFSKEGSFVMNTPVNVRIDWTIRMATLRVRVGANSEFKTFMRVYLDGTHEIINEGDLPLELRVVLITTLRSEFDVI